MNKKDRFFGSSEGHPAEPPSSLPAPDALNKGPAKATTRKACFVSVYVPRPCEAIGRALGTAYSAVSQKTLPDDMLSLLQRLDEIPASPGGDHR